MMIKVIKLVADITDFMAHNEQLNAAQAEGWDGKSPLPAPPKLERELFTRFFPQVVEIFEEFRNRDSSKSFYRELVLTLASAAGDVDESDETVARSILRRADLLLLGVKARETAEAASSPSPAPEGLS